MIDEQYQLSAQLILILQTFVFYSLKFSWDCTNWPFLPQNKQTSAIKENYEQIKHKHGNFQLIDLSDRHVFYFILRHLSPGASH